MRMLQFLNTDPIGRLRVGVLVVMIIAAVAMLIISVPADAQQDVPVTDPSKDPIGAVDLNDDEASIYVALAFTERTVVDVTLVEIVHGRARMNIGEPPLLRADVYDHFGKKVGSYNAWHPFWQYREGDDGKEEFILLDKGTGEMILPFSPELDSMTITDVALDQQILQIDLDPAIHEFCKNNPSHPACVTNLGLTKTSTPASVLVGEKIQYTLSVENHGPNPVRSFKVTDVLPDGVTYTSNNSACVEAPAPTLNCTVNKTLTVGATYDIEINVTADTDLDFSVRRPLSLVNHASVTNQAGDEADPSNNNAAVATDVRANSDLAVKSIDFDNSPIEISVNEVTKIAIQSTITNNGPSSPMDVSMLLTIQSLGTGLTVVVDDTNPNEVLALATGDVRSVSDHIIVTCEAPAMQPVTVTKQIKPLDPADADSNLTNNQMDVRIPLVCTEGGPRR